MLFGKKFFYAVFDYPGHGKALESGFVRARSSDRVFARVSSRFMPPGEVIVSVSRVGSDVTRVKCYEDA